MYGLIHQAARNMVLDTRGEAAWNDILQKSGLNDEHFIGADLYKDEVTFALIGAISDQTNIDMESLLEAFGRYWVGFAVGTPYGSMFKLAGETLDSLLNSLDEMHDSISSTMPGSVMPSFEVVHTDERQIIMCYRSPRKGLVPFVVGLFNGLLDYFDERGTVVVLDQTDGVRILIERESKTVVAGDVGRTDGDAFSRC